MLKTRSTCRACGSASLTDVMSLGDQYLASNFELSPDYPPVARKIPLDLVRCDPQRDENACGLLQLKHTVPPGLMYASYGYRSGVNQTMRDHLAGIAKEVEKQIKRSCRIVVDIGANDGTLLTAYSDDGCRVRRVGFEPSDIRPLQDGHGIEYVADYFNMNSYDSADLHHQVDAVTSIAMFYDLEDPTEFARDVSNVLVSEGLWVLELSYMPLMLQLRSFDTICHEHVGYYSLSVIERILDHVEMVAIDATLNDINGGSIRVTAAKRGSQRAMKISPEARARLYNLRRSEFQLGLDGPEPYEKFVMNVKATRLNLIAMLRTMWEQDKKIYGYGASTKGNVILQYTGVGQYLEAIADRNPAKVGRRTVGSDVRICSEEEMRAARPDYLLVLPWHFMPEFRERERALVEQGTKFIVPLPEPKIL
jgi:hypothetical protein